MICQGCFQTFLSRILTQECISTCWTSPVSHSSVHLRSKLSARPCSLTSVSAYSMVTRTIWWRPRPPKRRRFNFFLNTQLCSCSSSSSVCFSLSLQVSFLCRSAFAFHTISGSLRPIYGFFLHPKSPSYRFFFYAEIVGNSVTGTYPNGQEFRH